MGKSTGRNPYAKSLRTNGLFRHKVAKNGDDRAKQRDGWERGAKHKTGTKDMDDLEENVQVGDEVTVEVIEKGKKVTKKGMVKNPNGPAGTVGLSVDGEYALMPEDKIEFVNESLSRMFDLSK